MGGVLTRPFNVNTFQFKIELHVLFSTPRDQWPAESDALWIDLSVTVGMLYTEEVSS